MRPQVKTDYAHRVTAMILVVVMVLSMVPISVFAAVPGTVSTDIGKKEFVVNQPTTFRVDTVANDNLNQMVIGSTVFSDPDAIALLEYYEVQDGNWYPLNGDFGPASGFPMKDGYSTFRVTFKKAGVFSVDIFIKSAENRSDIICSTNATVSVSGSGSSLTTNIDKQSFAVGEDTDFTFTTWATDDAGKFVRGYFEFSDRTALNSLKYYNVNTDSYDEFYGEFGPTTGFPMYNDVTSTFRANFNKAGVYTVKAYMKDMEGNILCVRVANVFVKERSAISFGTESIEIKYSDVNAVNETLINNVSGAEFTYKSSNEQVVKVENNGILKPTGIGEATITVTREENSGFMAASATYTVKVVNGVQNALTWTQSIPETIVWNNPEGYTNTVLGGSGDGIVKYSSNNTDVAEVDPELGKLTLKKPGIVTITATKDGAGRYEEQTSSYTLEVIKANREFAFTDGTPDAIKVFGTLNNPIAGTFEDGIVIEYTSSDDSIAFVDDNGVITAKKVPMELEEAVVEITASTKETDYYYAASASYNLTILLAEPKSDFWFENGSTCEMVYGEAFANKAVGGDTDSITYELSDEDKKVVTVDKEGNVTALKSGVVTITATANRNEQYEAKTISYTLTVKRAAQSVIFDNGTNVKAITYGEKFINGAKSEFGDVEVTYTSSDNEVATVDKEGNVTALKSGSVTITATVEETEQYVGAQNSYTLTINKAEQVIEFEKGNKYTVTFNDNENNFINAASSNATNGDAEDKKGITPLYSIASGDEYVVEGSLNEADGSFKIKGAGTIVVSVSFDANDRYNEKIASYTLTVEKTEQSIGFEKAEYDMINGNYSFNAPKAAEKGNLCGTGVITYSVVEDKDGVVDTINHNTGEMVFTNKTGQVIIKATKITDANYKEAFAQYTLNVLDAKVGTNVFYELEGEKNDSGWYSGNVSVKAKEGYYISYAKEVKAAEWLDKLENAVSYDGTYEVTFHVRDKSTGDIYEAQTIKLQKDETAPKASIKDNRENIWESDSVLGKILTILTFGLWEPEQNTYKYTIESDDVIPENASGDVKASKVTKVEYFIHEGTLDVIDIKNDETALNEAAKGKWIEYKEGDEISISHDLLFVLYAKATDNAGNYVIVSTNGVVFDKTAVDKDNIVFTVPESFSGFYNDDVTVNVSVTDDEYSSGINKISYEVYNNNELTQSGVLYQFNEDGSITDPKFEDLTRTWADKAIVVDSHLNNSDNVVVAVTVVDNAGNTTTKELPLKICAKESAPELKVEFIDDPKMIGKDEKEVHYYAEKRKARIVFTGRTSVFESVELPNVVVSYPNGKTADSTTWFAEYWETTENPENPDLAEHEYIIHFNGSENYKFTVEYTDIFGESEKYKYESEVFVVDGDKPTASITIGETTWSKLLGTITFGLWKREKVSFHATYGDATGAIKIVEMYKTDSTTGLALDELEEIYKEDLSKDEGERRFKKYAPFTETKDSKFVVYLRVEDYAGRYDYFCSDGYVVDMKGSNIALTLGKENYTEKTHNDVPVYNGDVNVTINVKELEENSYSGIKEVKYWVTCDGKTTQEKVLYSFEYEDVPTYEELKHSFEETVTIAAADNNSCDVVFNVQVTDNAGNVTTDFVNVDIDKTAPTIKVTYEDEKAVNKIVDGRGYYPGNRTATIVIAERTAHFESEKAFAGISVKAVDSNSKAITANGVDAESGYVTNLKAFFGNDIEWVTAEGENANEATHTLVLPYKYDANYTFGIEYTDYATNPNDAVNTEGQTSYEFTIDKVAPYAAEVSVGSKTWNKLLAFLTFGLYNKEGVTVSAQNEKDATSPIEPVEYFKTDKTEMLSKNELEEVTEWSTTKPVIDEEKFVVYLKVTDFAGNYMFINSDGFVVDKTSSGIALNLGETNKTGNEHVYEISGDVVKVPIYNGDVDVNINVEELKENSYSGIKEVKYWVTCDGKTTQEKVLYSFEYDMSSYKSEDEQVPKYEDLKHSFEETVTIVAADNNSCDVVLNVQVTDNAGNIATDSVKVDIDITAPTIEVSYDNNEPRKEVSSRGYYNASREATIVITERTAHFNAENAFAGIDIKAVDSKDKPITVNDVQLEVDEKGNVVDLKALFGDDIEWLTAEGENANEATHTLVLPYNKDANYTFSISYEDLATNKNDGVDTEAQKNPYEFTVDTTRPIGTVTVGELGKWDKLINLLTFGLWSRDTVKVTGTNDDATSPVESVTYYKTSDIVAKTEENLNSITEWKSFDGKEGISVDPDERFAVYVKIVDYAGNTEYISTNGIIVDDTMPEFENVKPEITITPEPTNGIYNSDVTVGVSVIDPKMGDTAAYAGLKEIRYEVYNLGQKTQEGTLYSFEYTKENDVYVLRVYNKGVKVLEKIDYTPVYEDLLPAWEDKAAIVVDKDLNNSNDVKIVVYAVDNSGNANKAECDIKIDITPAAINVSYDNNDGDTTFADRTYFKANRRAVIVVTERNFNPEYFKYLITNTDGYIPYLSKWETREGTAANGDDTTHTATIYFDRDGDYQFNIESCIDLAMNENTPVTSGDTLAPWRFTIDKTAPIVNVTYDNNSVLNGNYYKEQRIATITVTEHNFESQSDRLVVKLNATDDGRVIENPVISQWISNGDVHTAVITYAADALYTFDFDYTDKAGNKTEDIAEQTFYVDKTNPVLTIEKIVDESANNDEGDIGFVMTATDTNFDVFAPMLTAIVKNGNAFETKQLEIGETTDIKNGKVFTVTNIDADGIYRINCVIVDKAGNAYSEVTLEKADGSKYVEKRAAEDTLVTFSVNREGSTFEIDKETAAIVEKYYIQNVEENVEIVEINADPLNEYSVTLNGKKLEEGKDYTVTENSGNAAWRKYTYSVNKELFADEGEYKLVVFSKDKAENDAFSDVKNASIEFVVDRTAPIVTVSGINNGGRYQTDNQVVTLIPTDDGGALKTLVVKMVDGSGKTVKEIINLTGDDLVAELEKNGGEISFEISEGLYQNVQIVCTDYATGNSEDTNTYDSVIKNVSVSSSGFMIFWANKGLRWGTIGGVSAVVIGLASFFIIKKKRKA